MPTTSSETPAKPSLKGALAVNFTKLIGQLSMKNAQRVGTGIGHFLWHTRSRARRVTETNLNACLTGCSARERRELAKTTMIETGKTMTEICALWSNPFDYGRACIESVIGEPLLEQALASERGLILILPHLGNWELTNHYVTSKTELLAMYQPAKIVELDRLIREARSRHGTTMVPTNAKGVKALYKHLKKGGTTVILADQEPPEKSGRFTEFFNIPTLTPILVPRLVKETQADALMIFTVRTKTKGKFAVHITPTDPALFSEDLTQSAQGLNRSIEQSVKKAIEQYQWSYKRFKRRPNPSDPSFYD